MRSSNLPPAVEKMDPEIRDWLMHHAQPASTEKRQVSLTFTLADTEYSLRHYLGAIPTGYRVIDRNKGGTIYREADATKATEHHIYLKSDTAALTVTLEIS